MRGRAVTRVSKPIIDLAQKKQTDPPLIIMRFSVMAGLVPANYVVQIASGPNA
jgi:hypothetical protein